MPQRLRVPLVPPSPLVKRSVARALLRGLCQRCPNCGIGPSMEGYLRIRDSCPHCHEPLGLIHADDGPAYFTLLISGHVVVPLVLVAEQQWQPPLVLMMVVAVAVLCLLIWRLLPRVKGAVLGLMWALRLKGDEVQGDLDRHG